MNVTQENGLETEIEEQGMLDAMPTEADSLDFGAVLGNARAPLCLFTCSTQAVKKKEK